MIKHDGIIILEQRVYDDDENAEVVQAQGDQLIRLHPSYEP
jgi:hypothetical protein